jgi:hypothetical protein
MISGFASCHAAVMTGHTRTQHFVVIQWNNHRQPVCGRDAMTGFANIRGGWVVARFAGGDTAIMTTEATANHFVVVQR